MQLLTVDDLVLEPLVPAHAEGMFEVLSEPGLYRYLEHPQPASVDALREVYARVEGRRSPDGSEQWLNWVVRRAGEPPLGYVQATVRAREAWIGFVFASRHWGRGHARRATQAVIAHLPDAYAVTRCLATVEAGNDRSIHLLQRLGFREATVAERDLHAPAPGDRLFVR